MPPGSDTFRESLVRPATDDNAGSALSWRNSGIDIAQEPPSAISFRNVTSRSAAATPGSIVSAITVDLAAHGGTFHLLDLIAEPDPADPDLARSVTDRDGLKRDLAARIAERGERATPALVERELAHLERAKAAADTIDAVRRAGGAARWHQVDLTDSDSVAAVLGEVRASHARVDVLLHAAGLEISHTLDTKPAKVKAREMIELVSDINAKFGDGKAHVTCWTCHLGSTLPEIARVPKP